MKNNLQAHRIDMRLSLQKLADLAGCSKVHVHQLEKGETNPSLPLAYRLSAVLGASIEDVFPDDTEYEEIVIKRVKIN